MSIAIPTPLLNTAVASLSKKPSDDTFNNRDVRSRSIARRTRFFHGITASPPTHRTGIRTGLLHGNGRLRLHRGRRRRR